MHPAIAVPLGLTLLGSPIALVWLWIKHRKVRAALAVAIADREALVTQQRELEREIIAFTRTSALAIAPPAPSLTITEAEGENGPDCPVCGNAFAKPFTRRATCRTCKTKIVARAAFDGSAIFVTDEQAEKISTESETLRHLQVKRGSPEYSTAEDALRSQLGRQPGAKEIAWRAAEDCLAGMLKRRDFHAAAMQTFGMALARYFDGQPFRDLLKKHADLKLRAIQSNGATAVQASCDCCEECDRGHGVTVSIADATGLFPKEKCDNDIGAGEGWCTCYWLPTA